MRNPLRLAACTTLCLAWATCLAGVEVTIVDRVFDRTSGAPAKVEIPFTATAGPATLFLAAGGAQGYDSTLQNIVLIEINGERLLPLIRIDRDTAPVEREVGLLGGENLLVVEMRGAPGTGVRLRLVQSFDGQIGSDTVWSGDVHVDGPATVLPDAVLTILPGTRVAMAHYRGYRNPERRLHFIVKGGIVAEGTAEAPIYFTSDAEIPQNGDWSMLRVINPTGPVRFSHAIFEFAQQGLNIWSGQNVEIRNSVFRWNNWEGIYFESSSTAEMDGCNLVENGYNGLAAEQFNSIDMQNCEVWRNGTSGIHVDASEVEIRESLVHDNGAHGLSVDDNGTLRAYGVASYDNSAFGLGQGQGTNLVTVSNFVSHGNGAGDIQGSYSVLNTGYHAPSSVDLGFQPDMTHALGYIPSDPLLDRYMYVYPDDETRQIVRKIGAGLGLTWSVTWDGTYLWTATVNGKIYRLDPVTGAVLQQFDAPGSQPWGMTWDGTHLWVVDFAEKRISEIDPATGIELNSYPTPDPAGGCKGVTWDGTYLNVMGWTSPKIYRMTTSGVLIDTIDVQMGGNAGGIAWDGSHFWIPAGKLMKVDVQGNIVGWIYPASEGTWDMSWDGQYLWATQRTNENWSDDKLFALKILEVQPPLP
jgi:DNA-binding beta-propeller fold protein YncE